jgi:hypothetical protein
MKPVAIGLGAIALVITGHPGRPDRLDGSDGRLERGHRRCHGVQWLWNAALSANPDDVGCHRHHRAESR